MASPQYVVVYGNPLDGLSIIGPFDSAEEATECGESQFERGFSDPWWVTPLVSPDEQGDERTPDLFAQFGGTGRAAQ